MDVLTGGESIWLVIQQMQLSWKVETARSCIQQEKALPNNLPGIPVQHKQPENMKKIYYQIDFFFVFLICVIEGSTFRRFIRSKNHAIATVKKLTRFDQN